MGKILPSGRWERAATLRVSRGEWEQQEDGAANQNFITTEKAITLIDVPGTTQDAGALRLDGQEGQRVQEQRLFYTDEPITLIRPGLQPAPTILLDEAVYEIVNAKDWGAFREIEVVRRDTA